MKVGCSYFLFLLAFGLATIFICSPLEAKGIIEKGTCAKVLWVGYLVVVGVPILILAVLGVSALVFGWLKIGGFNPDLLGDESAVHATEHGPSTAFIEHDPDACKNIGRMQMGE